jgi:hypothetical protein
MARLRYVQELFKLLSVFIRISEPQIWSKFRNLKNGKKYSDASLSSFLNSAINIEFVYLILTGINISTSRNNSERPSRLLKLSTLLIADSKKWAVDNKNAYLLSEISDHPGRFGSIKSRLTSYPSIDS